MDEIPFNFIGFFLTIIPILIFVVFLSRWFENSFEDNRTTRGLMKSLWNKLKNSIPIKVVKKDNFNQITKQLEAKTSDNYRLNNNNEILKRDIQRLEEKIIPAMPMIYGLKSQLDYKDRLLYFTATLDSEIFYQMPQVNGSIDYIADYICHSIRRELSMINISRLPDYCRKIKRDRYDQKEIKANLYTSGKIEER